MEWYWALFLLLGSLLFLFFTGMPVAFAFILVSVIGAFLWWGGGLGLEQLMLTFRESVGKFMFLPILMFILMGEVIYHSGIAPFMMDTVDKWLGRLPGRLGLVAVGSGTIFATLTGADIASVAMLGSGLVPQMEERGYKKPMTLGPILGSGCLAVMIPPSDMAVFVAALGGFSVARTLIAIIIPGLMMAALYAAYIVVRCWLQPSIAPAYEVTPPPLLEKIEATVKYILPVGFIIFAVIGVILLGIATPSEAGATGAIACFILAAAHRRLNWQMAKQAIIETLRISVMIFMIIVGAKAFSQLMAFSGASGGILELALGFPVSPLMVVISIQVLLIILGMFTSVPAMLMIIIPLTTPIILDLGFDPVWYAVLLLINVEIGAISPPFGLSLFVMKGVAPADTTMRDIYLAALPFIGCQLLVMALVIAFPVVVLWLPGIMG